MSPNSSSRAGRTGYEWDEGVDVVVVGSGAAGLTAALVAHQEGLDVLVLEKSPYIGGTSATSGGTIWIPLTDQFRRSSMRDGPTCVRNYIDRVAGSADERRRDAFFEAGPKALRYLERHTDVRYTLRERSPDYHMEEQGAAVGGRSLDPCEFDGRTLGRAGFAELRAPLAPFMVLGGMMVTMVDVHHLLAATRSFASWRHGMRLVLRYASDRLRGYARGTRLVMGNALIARLFKTLLLRGIPYRLNTPAEGLVRGVDGRVEGVRLGAAGRTKEVRARRGVILAAGGFPWHPRLRGEHFPQPGGAWSMAPEANTGDGVAMALAAGGVMRAEGAGPAFWAPISILERPGHEPLRYVHFAWDRAKPGLIAVDRNGRRFVNEADSYHRFVQAMHRAGPDHSAIPATLICDSVFIRRWGLGLALPGGRRRRHLIRAGYLFEAASLADLARQVGVDRDTLEHTIARVNEDALSGVDSEFAKGSTAYNQHLGDPTHRPNCCFGVISEPPFYAIKVYPGDIGTALGLQTDGDARVLDEAGAPIAGLYAVGNDMHSIMDGQYPSAGITLGPALTFGWLAGMHLAKGDAPTSTDRAAPVLAAG